MYCICAADSTATAPRGLPHGVRPYTHAPISGTMLSMDIAPVLSEISPTESLDVQRIPTGKFNESYFVSGSTGDVVLRIAPPPGTPVLFYERDMMRREPRIHSIVREHTRTPIPRITKYDFSGSLIRSDWLLMERLPGIPLSESPLWGKKAEFLYYQLGRALRDVHSITNAWHGYPEGSETGPQEPSWYGAFKNLWNRLLADVASTGLYSEDQRSRLSTLLDTHARSFNHNPKPSLLHMDVWSQNILAGPDGELLGLVDWDRGLWGDPEIEFSVLEYCGTSPNDFWRGYGSQPEPSRDYEVRRLFYLLYEHQKYIFIRAKRDGSPATAQRYVEESLRLARDLGY